MKYFLYKLFIQHAELRELMFDYNQNMLITQNKLQE